MFAQKIIIFSVFLMYSCQIIWNMDCKKNYQTLHRKTVGMNQNLFSRILCIFEKYGKINNLTSQPTVTNMKSAEKEESISKQWYLRLGRKGWLN